MKSENKFPESFSRILVGVVFLVNVQSALVFLIFPSSYICGFGLEGKTGEQIVRALGLLFLMWNVPYAFALVNPIRYFNSLIESVIMQAIGLIGESCILMFGGPFSVQIEATIQRFIIFDGCGLIVLFGALWLVQKKKKVLNNPGKQPEGRHPNTDGP